MGAVIALIARVVGEKAAPFVAWGLALALLGGALWWLRSDAYDDGVRDTWAEIERAQADLHRTDAALKDVASTEQIADIAATTQAEKELIDAIATIPDAEPSAIRVAAGCERLRRAGYVDTHLPAVCRPGGGSEADPPG